jgi:hypothetical protein
MATTKKAATKKKPVKKKPRSKTMAKKVGEAIVGRWAEIRCRDLKEGSYYGLVEELADHGQIIKYTSHGSWYHAFVPSAIISETRIKQGKDKDLDPVEDVTPFDFTSVDENGVCITLLDRYYTQRWGTFEGFTDKGVRFKYSAHGSTFHALIPYDAFLEMYYKEARGTTEGEEGEGESTSAE